jgi:hypothetical protein
VEITEATKLATSHNLFLYAREAFDLGFEQAMSKKRRFTKIELFDSLEFGGLRNFHRQAIWEAYKSGRFEAVTSFDIKLKY